MKKNLELRKETDADGTWYVMYINGISHKYKRDLLEAETYYENYKKFLLDGGKIIEVLKKETIDTNLPNINQNLTNQNVEIIQTNLSQ